MHVRRYFLEHSIKYYFLILNILIIAKAKALIWEEGNMQYVTVCSLTGLQAKQAGLGTEERKNCYPCFTNKAQQCREIK